MLFIECLNADNNSLEYFNLDKVLSIKPLPNNTTKLLMGAGLYHFVLTDTIKLVNINDILKSGL